ncbi:MAG: CPBP family intramembrane glutamic endopeptidase [Pseudomonadota bacterium]
MTDALATVGLHLAVLVVGAAAYVFVARKTVRFGWFAAALAVYVVYDAFLTRFYRYVPNVIGEDWNWTGKLMAIALVLAIASTPFFGLRNVGLTFHQRPGSWLAWLVLAVFLALIFYAAYATGDGVPSDMETIAFQWTMPGFDEELFYRGVMLLALNEAFVARANVVGAPIGFGGLLTSILFGVIHTLAWSDGGVEFDPAIFAMTGGPSLILLWLRERTGSILTPIIAHNVANGAFNLF